MTIEIVLGAAELVLGAVLWIQLVTARGAGHRLPPLWSIEPFPWPIGLTAVWAGLGGVGAAFISQNVLVSMSLLLVYALFCSIVAMVHNARVQQPAS
jgi:hypothetical protein